MQSSPLIKFSLGIGIAALAAKGLLIWSMGRIDDLSNTPLESQTPEVIDTANDLVSAVALIGLASAIVAFTKGARGQLLYASIALNSVAFLASPMVYTIF